MQSLWPSRTWTGSGHRPAAPSRACHTRSRVSSEPLCGNGGAGGGEAGVWAAGGGGGCAVGGRRI